MAVRCAASAARVQQAAAAVSVATIITCCTCQFSRSSRGARFKSSFALNCSEGAQAALFLQLAGVESGPRNSSACTRRRGGQVCQQPTAVEARAWAQSSACMHCDRPQTPASRNPALAGATRQRHPPLTAARHPPAHSLAPIMLVLAVHTVATQSANVPFAVILLQDHITGKKVPSDLKCRQVRACSSGVPPSHIVAPHRHHPLHPAMPHCPTAPCRPYRHAAGAVIGRQERLTVGRALARGAAALAGRRRQRGRQPRGV